MQKPKLADTVSGSCFLAALIAAIVLCTVSSTAAPTDRAASETTHPVKVHFVLQVPEDTTRTVYITGTMPGCGHWEPNRLAMSGKGKYRTWTTEFDKGEEVEYKYSLGTWAEQRLNAHGLTEGNFKLTADRDNMTVRQRAYGFGPSNPDPNRKMYGQVTGNVTLWKDVTSKNPETSRSVIVWLPPDYNKHPERRYPVIYMQDGQNLMDPKTSNVDLDWAVDETLTDLIKQGRMEPVIVVGTYATSRRKEEYDPNADGEKYGKFLIEELMPRVNTELRTLTGPGNTTIMGSTTGGLIALYLGWKHPEVFGKAAGLSAEFTTNKGQFLDELQASGGYPKSVKLYFDYGLPAEAHYAQYDQRLDAMLKSWGWKPGKDYYTTVVRHSYHTEKSWRKQFPVAVQWLFGHGKLGQVFQQPPRPH